MNENWLSEVNPDHSSGVRRDLVMVNRNAQQYVTPARRTGDYTLFGSPPPSDDPST